MRFRHVLTIALVTATAALGTASAADGVKVGQAAPAFSLPDQTGTKVSLADFDGRIRVLEWINPDCPFVKRHYAAETMEKLADRYRDKGVVWLTVNSTHYMDREANAKFHAAHDLPYPILVDSNGEAGKRYGARTTPHMFIVDRTGTVVYAGAIDDDPRGGSGGKATNHVAAALDELLAGKAVTTAETRPYGCSVKYAK
jgi:peroxiredoxin